MAHKKRALAVTASVSAMALALSACGSSSKSSSSSATTAGSGATSATTSGATLTGACAPYSQYAGHPGTVTIFGSILAPESTSLETSWSQFEKCTGITIQYTGSNSFESQLPVEVEGGSPPDLAVIPQPGLLAEMVNTGAVKKPPAQTVANENNWPSIWKTLATVNGTFWAAPESANMKTLVWYSPQQFAANGWTVPTTWQQLMTLSAQIASSGKMKPWCGGISSGTATGWPSADWLSQIVLSDFGPTVYSNWVAGKVKFSSPQIQAAMTIVKNWMQNPAWVNGGFGGVSSIATTTFQDAGLPILKGQCAMLQQASFYEAQLPTGTTVGSAPTDQAYAFYLPPVNPSLGSNYTPIMGGGEFTTAFSSAPSVQMVQNYLSSPEWADSRIKVAPGWVSANTKVDKSLYTDPIDQLSAKYLSDPNSTFEFSADDSMPAAVENEFWKAMTAWFSGSESQSAAAAQVDAAWSSAG